MSLAGTAHPTTAFATAGGYQLLTEDQKETEALALQVLKSPEVQQARRQVADVFHADPVAATTDGRSTLEEAVDETLFAAVLDAVADDPAHPKIFWALNAPHQWDGSDVPGSRGGVDNPDNIYRYVFLDGVSHYTITGRHNTIGPAQFTLELLNAAPGVNGIGKQIAILKGDKIKLKPDGSFKIEIGPDPANGRPNYLQTKPSAKVILIRDSLSDWSSQTPNALKIQRIEAAEQVPKSPHELALRAAEIAPGFASFWLNFRDHDLFPVFYHNKTNGLVRVDPRQGGWGYAGGGRFDLAPDEALVVTVSTLGASYTGFQLADPWMISTDYIHHTGSLNNHQIAPNADGTVTYVISAVDPGVQNWLDTNGLHQGFFQLRWQQVPAGVDASGLVRRAKLVKIADLPHLLPAVTKFVSPAERVQLLADRLAAYNRRISN